MTPTQQRDKALLQPTPTAITHSNSTIEKSGLVQNVGRGGLVEMRCCEEEERGPLLWRLGGEACGRVLEEGDRSCNVARTLIEIRAQSQVYVVVDG